MPRPSERRQECPPKRARPAVKTGEQKPCHRGVEQQVGQMKAEGSPAIEGPVERVRRRHQGPEVPKVNDRQPLPKLALPKLRKTREGVHRRPLLDERVIVIDEPARQRSGERNDGENGRRERQDPRTGRRAVQFSAHWLKRTATVFVSPALQITLVTFLPSSALMKMTVWGPGAAEYPSFGVPPSG
jgi:hypothetical protein